MDYSFTSCGALEGNKYSSVGSKERRKRMVSDMMFMDHTIIVRSNPCCHPTSYYFKWAETDFLYTPSHYRMVHTTSFVTPAVNHWLKLARWIHQKGSIRRPNASWADALPLSFIHLKARAEGIKSFSALHVLTQTCWDTTISVGVCSLCM